MTVLAKDVKRKGKLNKQCKICGLVEVNAQLWTDIHKKVLEDGMARAAVCRWANTQLDLINLDLPPEEKLKSFNGENFARHFHNHIPEYEKMKRVLRDKALGKERDLGAGFSDQSIAVVETFIEDHLEEYTDYTSITKMIETLEVHLVAYNNYLMDKSKIVKKGNRPLPLSELSEYKGLVESLADLKLKLAKIRNSSVVSGSAVRRTVTLCTESFINQLVMATEEAQRTLQDSFPESNLPSEVVEKARHRIANSIKGSLPELMDKVFKEFNIK